MEQIYWEQFMKNGGVCDYLEYKMEVYGHSGGKEEGTQDTVRGGSFESDRSDRNGAFYGAGRGI